ncbi:GntR family transcriptional regulator [Amylibacter sp. SFDW26]|uniref:GntR family transcriptional regulator n=1 Tax=Amylibacter sp. SFDW26 TaxID=2652722 RepID=UPI0012619637|nr:GntR family transcriptional regulator [Amylibacter sp. SFDW26]KAB7613384.1 GntR family transcriptional regulator [Amylibacter sp. SFDW26]
MSIDGIAPVARHKTLAEDTYDRLRQAIKTGNVMPGEKISARSVADSAKVSFTPAREAVARLISEGALEQSGPKTVVVPTLTIQDLAEINAIRRNVEGLAAELAVANFQNADIEELEAIQTLYENTRKSTSFQESLRLNEKFHFKIYRACGLPRLVAIIETLWIQIGPSFNLLNSADPLPENPHQFHRDVIQGMKDKDVIKVRQAIQTDLEFGYERLVGLYKQKE